jgi:hypothetical protein
MNLKRFFLSGLVVCLGGSTPVWSQEGSFQPVPAQPTQPVSSTYKVGSDLRQVITLLINESLEAGNRVTGSTYNELYTQLLARSYGNPTPLPILEQQIIQETLSLYGAEGDRYLTAEEFDALLNRPRPPLQAQAVAPRVVYLAVPELTPATAREIQQALYRQDYSQGIILDLRGSIGYDPQVVADVARVFLPRYIAPLVITEDRFNQLTSWDSDRLTVAAGFPLAVLIDGNTRQGAALLAAQLSASGTTTVIGQPAPGSERQTRFFLLPSGAAIELNVARWQTGDNRPIQSGVSPSQAVTGEDTIWLNAGISALSRLPSQPRIPQRPMVFVQDGVIGRFKLGQDTRNIDTSLLGNVDFVPASSGRNVFQPNSDLKIFYVEDYILFTYRTPAVVESYYADRIYITDPAAQTSEGISIGSTYANVIEVYGQPGESGYNETIPFPEGSRERLRGERYYVNYDAVGVSFIFEVGTNQVVGIGLYKPGA